MHESRSGIPAAYAERTGLLTGPISGRDAASTISHLIVTFRISWAASAGGDIRNVINGCKPIGISSGAGLGRVISLMPNLPYYLSTSDFLDKSDIYLVQVIPERACLICGRVRTEPESTKPNASRVDDPEKNPLLRPGRRFCGAGAMLLKGYAIIYWTSEGPST